MGNTIQAVRGMHDILPAHAREHFNILEIVRQQLERYCYQPIILPALEKSELFARSVGESTDIVEKEMYAFADRGGDQLALRPEGTAGCVRAVIENSLTYNKPQRLWYAGPMFRRERPQKGRYRQFFQLGVEAYNMAGPDIDAEMLLLQYELWQRLGIAEHVSLQINTLGSTSDRAAYKQDLVAYLQRYEQDLDDDSKRRLYTNPLRILDSKNPEVSRILEQAPVLSDYLDDSSKAYFDSLLAMLTTLGIPYQVNNRLVRGLDYYCHGVYEWVTDALGAQGTISAGGRYDHLVAKLGGKETPACGFAIGLERVALVREQVASASEDDGCDVYIIVASPDCAGYGQKVAQLARQTRPDWRVYTHCFGGSMKSQFKKADRSRAQLALIVAADEASCDQVTIKYLRQDKPQATIALTQLPELLLTY